MKTKTAFKRLKLVILQAKHFNLKSFIQSVFGSFLFLSFMAMPVLSQAQLGGTKTYRFLEMAPASRMASLGSNMLSVNDYDITLAYANPALISDKMHSQLALNYLNYFADINAGFLSYGQQFKKTGTFVASLHFINYGDFTETDALGNQYGSFSAAEYALTVGWAKRLSERFSLGVNLKNILSQLESYSSYGIAFDLAGNYLHSNERFSASLVASNIGRQVTSYTGQYTEDLPFNLKMGFSTRFEHAPLRLHLILDQLQQWDLTYQDPNAEEEVDPFTGEVVESKGWDFGDKLMRHVVVGGEFIPGKGNFSVRLGYNYRRRAEMKIASRKAMVGFSWGFGIKISKFRLSYARATYSLAGATNHFTITTAISEFLKDK